MRVELTIQHKAGDLVAALEQILGPHDPKALADSAMAQKSPLSVASISYSSYAPGLLVMAWPTPGQVVLFVESSGGRLRRAAADVWQFAKTGGAHMSPTLQSLVLLDEDANDEIAIAGVGFAANLDRPELRYTLVVGVVTVLWLAIALAVFGAPADLVLGAVPAVLAAFFAGGLLLADSRSKKLVWR